MEHKIFRLRDWSTLANNQTMNRWLVVTDILLVITAIINIIALEVKLSALDIVVLLILTMVYLVLSTFGPAAFDFLKLKSLVVQFSLHLTFIILISSTMLLITHGASWILMLPVVAQCVIFLTWPWAVAVCLIIWMLSCLAPTFDPARTLPDLLQVWTSLGAATLFVGLFTMLAVRERDGRAEVERLAGELEAANAKLRDYSTQVGELATTKERNRLAREIHDSLGHYLTVINVQIGAAKTVLDTDRPKALDALDKAQSLTREGLAEVRQSVAALRATPMSSRSLPEAISVLVEENRTSGVITELNIAGEPRPLEPPVELTLYRVAQEGLTNIRKHAFATRSEVKLAYDTDHKIRLVVSDNGVGQTQFEGGFGLMGLRERVNLLNGQVAVKSAPGKGFSLEVELVG